MDCGGSRLRQADRTSSLESFHRTSDRLIFDCINSLTDLLNRQISRFPRQSELLPSQSSHENIAESSVQRISPEARSTMRTLSEDAWNIFRSLTSLIKQKASSSKQPARTDSPSDQRRMQVEAEELQSSLEGLLTKVQDFERRSQESGLTLSRKTSRDKWGEPNDYLQRIREMGASQPSFSDPSTAELMSRTVPEHFRGDVYSRVQDAAEFAGQREALQNMARVLTELDSLVKDLESDTSTYERGFDQREDSYDGEWSESDKVLPPKKGRQLMGNVAVARNGLDWTEEGPLSSTSDESRSTARNSLKNGNWEQYKYNIGEPFTAPGYTGCNCEGDRSKYAQVSPPFADSGNETMSYRVTEERLLKQKGSDDLLGQLPKIPSTKVKKQSVTSVDPKTSSSSNKSSYSDKLEFAGRSEYAEKGIRGVIGDIPVITIERSSPKTSSDSFQSIVLTDSDKNKSEWLEELSRDDRPVITQAEEKADPVSSLKQNSNDSLNGDHFSFEGNELSDLYAYDNACYIDSEQSESSDINEQHSVSSSQIINDVVPLEHIGEVLFDGRTIGKDSLKSSVNKSSKTNIPKITLTGPSFSTKIDSADGYKLGISRSKTGGFKGNASNQSGRTSQKSLADSDLGIKPLRIADLDHDIIQDVHGPQGRASPQTYFGMDFYESAVKQFSGMFAKISASASALGLSSPARSPSGRTADTTPGISTKPMSASTTGVLSKLNSAQRKSTQHTSDFGELLSKRLTSRSSLGKPSNRWSAVSIQSERTSDMNGTLASKPSVTRLGHPSNRPSGISDGRHDSVQQKSSVSTIGKRSVTRIPSEHRLDYCDIMVSKKASKTTAALDAKSSRTQRKHSRLDVMSPKKKSSRNLPEKASAATSASEQPRHLGPDRDKTFVSQGQSSRSTIGQEKPTKASHRPDQHSPTCPNYQASIKGHGSRATIGQASTIQSISSRPSQHRPTCEHFGTLIGHSSRSTVEQASTIPSVSQRPSHHWSTCEHFEDAKGYSSRSTVDQASTIPSMSSRPIQHRPTCGHRDTIQQQGSRFSTEQASTIASVSPRPSQHRRTCELHGISADRQVSTSNIGRTLTAFNASPIPRERASASTIGRASTKPSEHTSDMYQVLTGRQFSRSATGIASNERGAQQMPDEMQLYAAFRGNSSKAKLTALSKQPTVSTYRGRPDEYGVTVARYDRDKLSPQDTQKVKRKSYDKIPHKSNRGICAQSSSRSGSMGSHTSTSTVRPRTPEPSEQQVLTTSFGNTLSPYDNISRGSSRMGLSRSPSDSGTYRLTKSKSHTSDDSYRKSTSCLHTPELSFSSLSTHGSSLRDRESWGKFPTDSKSCPDLEDMPTEKSGDTHYSTDAVKFRRTQGMENFLRFLCYLFLFVFTFATLWSSINTHNKSFTDCSAILLEDMYRNLELRHNGRACV